METTYKEIKITYQEQENNWLFELRGRERTVESLAAAKEAIDKPFKPKEEGPAFERFDAWIFHGNEFKHGVVLSEAYSRYQSKMYWVKLDGAKVRFQAQHYYVYRCTPEQDKLAKQCIAFTAQIEVLAAEREFVKEKMSHL
jgi:hypothetical protein